MSIFNSRANKHRPAFTIVELLIIIATIGILTTIAFVAYGSWQARTASNVAKSDLTQVASAMQSDKNFSDGYKVLTPGAVFDGGAATKDLFTSSPDILLTYVSGDKTTYCIQAQSKSITSVVYHYNPTTGSDPVEGTCDGGEAYLIPNGSDEITPPTGGGGDADGTTMQTITNANCPTVRTRVVDKRDDHTYWVKKLADGKCWMLTNLAYAGGGTNTYGDTKTLTNGTSDMGNWITPAPRTPKYAIPPGANPTTEPTAPSTSTDGGASNPQYGYLYNWCGSHGGQTVACNDATTPALDMNISVCPSGWRLPTGGSGGELDALNNAVNGGSTSTDSGLRTTWLAQYGGYVVSGFSQQGIMGYYVQAKDPSPGYVYGSGMYYTSSNVVTTNGLDKYVGASVRCVAM